jgi:hypothetical protein
MDINKGQAISSLFLRGTMGHDGNGLGPPWRCLPASLSSRYSSGDYDSFQVNVGLCKLAALFVLIARRFVWSPGPLLQRTRKKTEE